MTAKINGGPKMGVWGEQEVTFLKATFSAAADGASAYSLFGVPDGLLDQLVRYIETKATILAISDYNGSTEEMWFMLGANSGWTCAATDGIIVAALAPANASYTNSGTLVRYGDAGYSAPVQTIEVRFAVFTGLAEAGSGDLVSFGGVYRPETDYGASGA